jgi:hypothetical protein
MRSRNVVTWMVLISTLAAPVAIAFETESAVEAQLIGNYELVSYERFDERGAATAVSMTGRISYDDAGNMAAQLMPAGYESAEDDASGRYIAYFGRYELDPATAKVTHHVAGSSLARWVGTPLVRYYAINDDTLTLSLRDASGRTTSTLTWRRLR